MTCDFAHCNRQERGGCPCRVVAEHGGELTSRQVAEVLGEPPERIRSLEAMLYAKMRNTRGRWADVLVAWPEWSASTWDATDERATYIGEMEAQAMNKQITRRWRELEWTP